MQKPCVFDAAKGHVLHGEAGCRRIPAVVKHGIVTVGSKLFEHNAGRTSFGNICRHIYAFASDLVSYIGTEFVLSKTADPAGLLIQF